jgi:hypothetical protein
MRLFLSFASPDRRTAERIQLALLGAGHEVFFDEASLPAGSDYNSRIREAIATSDVYVFLISPHSVGEGRYVRTELRLVKAKWPKPWGYVLPVMIQPTEYDLIDPYLAAVTILEPHGNVSAEVAARVHHWPKSSGGPTAPSNEESSHVSLVAARLDTSKSCYDVVQSKDGQEVVRSHKENQGAQK